MSKIRRTNKNAIKFDGSNDAVVVGDHDAHSFTDGTTDLPFTITAWVFVPDVSADQGPIVTKVDFTADTTGNEFMLRQNSSGDIEFYLYDNVSTDVQGNWNSRIYVKTQATQLTDSTWHHVAATYDGSKNVAGMNVYVDGDLTAVNRFSSGDGNAHPAYVRLRNTTTSLIIGGQNDPQAAAHIFEEKMADVCIFNKELTAAEISEVYNAGKIKNMTKASTYSNLISWWKMGDDQDTTGTGGIKDYVGGFNGTLTNGAAIREDLTLGSDIESDPRTAGIHIHQNFGKTRGPKSPLQYTQNLVGNTNYIIPSSASNELGANGWDIANEFKEKGLPTENQRYMHLLLDSSTSTGGNKNVRIAALGYINAFGIWSALLKYDGDELPAITTTLQDGTAEYYVFDILGVDRVLFFPTNNNADDISDWQLRVAFSSF